MIYSGSGARNKIYVYVVREFILWITIAFELISALLFLGFISAGVWHAFSALSMFWMDQQGISSEFKTGKVAAIVQGLQSVEIILLAPLSYVFISAIGNFVTKIGETGQRWREALQALVAAKSLTTSLLASIIAVDLVGRILSGKKLVTEDILLECLIFVVLVGYLLFLEFGLKSEQR